MTEFKPPEKEPPKKNPSEKNPSGKKWERMSFKGNKVWVAFTPEGRHQENLPKDCIHIYTDGASSGNPGPAGIGAVLLYHENQKQISQSIGIATNNVAELSAIKIAISHLKRYDLPVRIFSDSSYAIGVLTREKTPQANRELVLEIKRLILKFKDVKFIKVKGHAGIKENEVADFLATSAILRPLP